MFSLILQMDLERKFDVTTSSRSIPISSLNVNQGYDIVFAERAVTRFGPSVVLTLILNAPHTVKVYLPKRYAVNFNDEEIAAIQSGQVHLKLKYLGTCPLTRSFELAISQ
jgi:hypothetical protein